MTGQPDDSKKTTVRKSLEARETDDLLEIWTANRRYEWTDDAFEAIRAILAERLGSAPPQNEAVTENLDNLDQLSAEEEMWLEEEYQWDQRKMLFRLAKWARILAWFMLVWPVVEYSTYLRFPIGVSEWGGTALAFIDPLLRGSFYFLVLYAVRYLLVFAAVFLERLRGSQVEQTSPGIPDQISEAGVTALSLNQQRLETLAFWSGIFSWVVVVVYILLMGWEIVAWGYFRLPENLNYPANLSPFNLMRIEIKLVATGGMGFLILQALRHGLLALNDLIDLTPSILEIK